MKKLALVAILSAFTLNCFAQFKLSGKINHYTGSSTGLRVNIPVVFGYFEQNSMNIPVSKNGSFTVIIPNKGQRFATLTFQGSPHTLLLTAKKNLVIELDQNDKNIKIISGSAAGENSLIDKIKLDEPPIFLLSDSYNRLNATALVNQVLKPYLAMRDKKMAMINQSDIAPSDKKLITAELKYLTYNNLYELTDVGAENPAVLNKFVAEIYSKVDVKPDVMPAGPQYYIFANNYLRYQENKSQPGSAKSPLSRWESAVKYLPPAVTEQFGYQLIMRAFYDNDGTQVRAVSLAYLKKFPTGIYSADVRKKSASVK
jgi:hypothetical protein